MIQTKAGKKEPRARERERETISTSDLHSHL